MLELEFCYDLPCQLSQTPTDTKYNIRRVRITSRGSSLSEQCYSGSVPVLGEHKVRHSLRLEQKQLHVINIVGGFRIVSLSHRNINIQDVLIEKCPQISENSPRTTSARAEIQAGFVGEEERLQAQSG